MPGCFGALSHHHQNGDLTKLLKSVQKGSAQECPVEYGGGGVQLLFGQCPNWLHDFFRGASLREELLQRRNLGIVKGGRGGGLTPDKIVSHSTTAPLCRNTFLFDCTQWLTVLLR